ncbi:MAG TPA: aminotransferase class I/II-fold pyridoxal phosphate-dependent enzyme [Nitrososphaerales archaeon]|nr:aminotransferase class I/II-fold pyridoxal phosphate-dependent enzyme [Nitrososphaerales archaeon]
MTGDSTRSVHEAEPYDQETGALVTPIFETSTFGFTKAAEVAPAMAGERGYVYSRWDNPTVVRLEKKLAAFEETEDGAAFGSGMAAISTTVFSLIEKGSHAVGISDLYGGTFALLSSILPRLGVETTLVDTTNFEEMARAVKRNTRLILIETPTNPTLKLVDISRVAKLAHEVGAALLVDNTFASPINQTPITMGADFVLHSATKYLNGHADVVAGLAVASKERAHAIKMMRREFGGTLDPLPAWLVLRGMKTMAIRVKQQNDNAQALAELLSMHRRVKAVNYPGLKAHPQHALAKKQMRGFGGMLSFDLKGTVHDAMKFTESLKVASLAASLGGVETLVSQPALMTHTQMSAEERAKTGIPDTLVRVSVGIEDSADLVRDFEQALSSV